jgi:carbon-monoxide dehydrogenase large subunit
MSNRQMGRSLARLEDERFLTGRGHYVEDVDAAGMLHGYVLRSPHAHAIIESIGADTARAVPGVHAVYTEADLREDGLGPLPCTTQVATLAPLVIPPRPALAHGRVRHVGDPVAFIVAESREAARDAAELIEVAYESLDAVVDAPAALESDAPRLWDEAPGNLSYRFQKGDRAAVDAAFAAAAHVVEITLVNNRVVQAPLEPRAAIGRYDAGSGEFHLLFTGQGVHGIRKQLAESVFRLPEERFRFVAPDVGGGFGSKNFLYPEWVLVLFAARRLGRTVRWIADRAEDFLGAAQGRDNHTNGRLALDAKGRFLALDVKTLANLGAYLSGNGPGSSTLSPSTAMGGLYVVPAVFMDVRGVFTNTVPIDAYRGAGKPEANYLIERLVDLAARQLGIDPVELRRRNLIASFPHRTGLGMQIDCGRFVENLEEGVRLADRAGFESRRAASQRAGRLRGMGVACFLETSRGAPNEGAEIRFEPDGRVALLLGTQSNGQGHETSYPQIAADLLGLPIETFRYVQADTREVKYGHGHGGARSMHMGGQALVQAIEGVIAKGRAIAARLLQADPAEVEFGAGRFAVRDSGVGGSGRSIELLALASAATDPANLPDGTTPGLDTYAFNQSDVFTFPSGCHVAEIELDPETGRMILERYTIVDDYGRLINPVLTAGQVQGGVAQGIGQAMLEHTVYDAQSGQLLSGSFMDYTLPRADDLPGFDITFAQSVTAANRLGVKGSGQAGCIAAPQTIMNAVLDALGPLGIRDLDMPATPERVWQAIVTARRG